MSAYKLFYLKNNDRVMDVVRVACSCDSEAIGLLDGRMQHHTIEIWQGHRFLVRANRPALVGPFGVLQPYD